MSQIFSPGSNTLARLSLLIGGLTAVLIIGMLLVSARSPHVRDTSNAGLAIDQPVKFNHKLHSDQLNISCSYCHTSSETSSYAGISDTHTCMSCHSQIATYSELLEPVRSSYETGEPIRWNKVHDVADHVYFNHSSHVTNGFACETCHGRVDQMNLVWQAENMTMNWCLECHQNPEEFIRPQDEVYTFGYEQPENQTEIGLDLIEEYNVTVEGLSNCGTCHR